MPIADRYRDIQGRLTAALTRALDAILQNAQEQQLSLAHLVASPGAKRAAQGQRTERSPGTLPSSSAFAATPVPPAEAPPPPALPLRGAVSAAGTAQPTVPTSNEDTDDLETQSDGGDADDGAN